MVDKSSSLRNAARSGKARDDNGAAGCTPLTQSAAAGCSYGTSSSGEDVFTGALVPMVNDGPDAAEVALLPPPDSPVTIPYI